MKVLVIGHDNDYAARYVADRLVMIEHEVAVIDHKEIPAITPVPIRAFKIEPIKAMKEERKSDVQPWKKKWKK